MSSAPIRSNANSPDDWDSKLGHIRTSMSARAATICSEGSRRRLAPRRDRQKREAGADFQTNHGLSGKCRLNAGEGHASECWATDRETLHFGRCRTAQERWRGFRGSDRNNRCQMAEAKAIVHSCPDGRNPRLSGKCRFVAKGRIDHGGLHELRRHRESAAWS